MPRAWFGGGAADFVFTPTSGRFIRTAAATLTFWTAKTGGTQHTDLLLDGSPVSSITVGPDGQVPEFQGPDGVIKLWADAGGGRVQLDAAISSEDSAVALLVGSPESETGAALSATYARGGGTVYLDNHRGGGVSDTTALKNAVAAATGKTLVLGSVSLTIEDVIEVTADNVTIDARGASVNLVDNGTGEGRIVRFLDCERPAWIGGTISQTAAARTGVYGLLTATNTLDLLVDGVNLVGGSSASFWGSQLDGFLLRGLRCRNPKADGIHISRGARDGQIVDPLIVAAQDDAIGLVSVMADGATSYNQIENIAISNPVVRDLVTLGSGIALVGPKHVTVTGGVIDNPVDAGVKISDDAVAGTHVPSDISITGTRVRDCTDSYRVGTAADVVLSNVVGQNGSGLGLLIAGATRLHMVGGKLRGHTDAGVYSASGSGNNLVGVDLRGNATASAGAAHALTSCITA